MIRNDLLVVMFFQERELIVYCLGRDTIQIMTTNNFIEMKMNRDEAGYSLNFPRWQGIKNSYDL